VKNFDEKRGERLDVDRRTFVIAGEHFVARAGLTPEELLVIQDVDADMPEEQSFKHLDQLIVALVEGDDAAERWEQLRAQRENPLTANDIREVFDWLVEIAIGRPPTQPSPSSASQGSNGTPSTENSSSEPAVASTG
jgi:hypothetical protein